MTALATLVFLAPALVLEPDPGAAKRLQPRRVSASTFLRNGWNQYEQNYLPLYAADDDPATAWVEGASGAGVGESLVWIGPRLRKARAYKVFIRSGYQKTKALHAANARPRQVRIEPVAEGEGSLGLAAAGKVVEHELADQLGWQQVDVPTQAEVSGVRITLVSVYPGSKYEDACLSDVRVYVDGDDPYKPAVEATAAEEIRRFVTERRRAAGKGEIAHVELEPEYKGAELVHRKLEKKDLAGAKTTAAGLLALVPEKPAHKDALAKARAAAAVFDQVDADARGGKPLPAEWRLVRLVPLRKDGGAASTSLGALREVDEWADRLVSLLHRQDIGLFEERAPARTARDEVEAFLALKKGAPSCAAACKSVRQRLAFYAFESPEDPEGCSCARQCKGKCGPDAQELRNAAPLADKSGTWAQGGLAQYTHLLRAETASIGDRESFLQHRQDLVVFDGDRAGVVLTRMSSWGRPLLVAHVFEWKDGAKGKARLAGGTSFVVETGYSEEGGMDDRPDFAAAWRFTPAPVATAGK